MPGALYPDTDRLAGAKLVERIGKLNTDRLKREAVDDTRASVRDAVLINDLLDHATLAELKSALLHATTPELMTLAYVPGGVA